MESSKGINVLIGLGIVLFLTLVFLTTWMGVGKEELVFIETDTSVTIELPEKPPFEYIFGDDYELAGNILDARLAKESPMLWVEIRPDGPEKDCSPITPKPGSGITKITRCRHKQNIKTRLIFRPEHRESVSLQVAALKARAISFKGKRIVKIDDPNGYLKVTGKAANWVFVKAIYIDGKNILVS